MPGRRLNSILITAALAVLVAGCGGSDVDGDSKPEDLRGADAGQQVVPDRSKAASEQDAPVDAAAAQALRIVAEMNAEERAGAVIMTKLVGTSASPEELQLVRDRRVGGIILFGSNVVDESQLETLIGSLDAARGAGPAGLLVSVDQEGGDIRNIPFAPPEQTQSALGSDGDAAATRASAAATGAALASLGIDMSLGPVADLAAPPNRTMAGRAFGSDPQFAASHVAAAVAGLQSGGTSATTKHFPGFGASTANSDEAVAYVDRSLAELRRDELAPFRSAISAGTRAIMVSHGIHRELGSKLPGTLDPRIVTDLLRGELGFDGVAMTDSMNARGLREAWGDTVPRACPIAIGAGIDIVLLTGSIETARLCGARIVEAVEEGALPAARLEEAAVRVTKLQLVLAEAHDLGGGIQQAP